jgi:hypothetical protein
MANATTDQIEEQQEPVIPTDESSLHGFHCLACALVVAGAREHRPGLGDGVDLAFVARR